MLVMWILTFFTSQNYDNIVLFYDVFEIFNIASLYGGYWVMVIMIFISTAYLPGVDEVIPEFDSFYNSNGVENSDKDWIGVIAFLLYLILVVGDVFVQIKFHPCLIGWREWAIAEIAI